MTECKCDFVVMGSLGKNIDGKTYSTRTSLQCIKCGETKVEQSTQDISVKQELTLC